MKAEFSQIQREPGEVRLNARMSQFGVSQFGHVRFKGVIENNFGPIRQERVKKSDYTATIRKNNLQNPNPLPT